MKVGINGFGRIGKAIFRINHLKKYFDIVAINDINRDNKNLAYQLKYDSTYGRLPDTIEGNENGIVVNGKEIKVFHEKDIFNVPWNKYDIDIIVDASGIHSNVLNARMIKDVGKCIITHSPEKKLVDKHIIVGINENTITNEDFLISSSICDANAVAPILNILDKKYGVEHGFLVTLHAILGYQQLLDGQSVSFGYPGTTHGRYELGRSSLNSLIPKPTSCIDATCKVLPEMRNKFLSMSYRIPTTIVSAADLSIKLGNNVTKKELLEVFKDKIRSQKYHILKMNNEPLVSIDFKKSDYSAVIDERWLMINDGNYVKLVLWYDNEWSYSSRTVDLVKHVGEKNYE